MTEKQNAKWLQVIAKVCYWEDSTVNGMNDDVDNPIIPCRSGDYWTPRIDIQTGQIQDWTHGVFAEVCYKVCDEGTYTLLDEKNQVIDSVEGYVISSMCPEGGGYGDYIIMDIDENGVIKNWAFNPDDFNSENLK